MLRSRRLAAPKYGLVPLAALPVPRLLCSRRGLRFGPAFSSMLLGSMLGVACGPMLLGPTLLSTVGSLLLAALKPQSMILVLRRLALGTQVLGRRVVGECRSMLLRAAAGALSLGRRLCRSSHLRLVACRSMLLLRSMPLRAARVLRRLSAREADMAGAPSELGQVGLPRRGLSGGATRGGGCEKSSRCVH